VVAAVAPEGEAVVVVADGGANDASWPE